MHGCPDRTGSICDRKADGDPLSLRYLVKRPAYELALVMSMHVPPWVRWGQAVAQVCFTTQEQTADIVLALTELQAFYEDLGDLMAYLSRERARPGAAPQAVGHAVGANGDALKRPDNAAKKSQPRTHRPQRGKRRDRRMWAKGQDYDDTPTSEGQVGDAI
jgi:hypothetical protein